MGIGIYPVFEPPVASADFDSDGKLLLAEFGGLDEIAASCGLPPISAFGDNRPVPEGFEGDYDELADLIGPWDAWFPIGDGLRSIEGLARVIRTDAAVRSLLSRPDEVVEELDGLASCLRRAAEATATFRLEVG